MNRTDIHYVPLPEDIRGAVKQRKDGGYIIAINSNLSADDQAKALVHELSHIAADHFNREADIQTIEAEAEALSNQVSIKAARLIERAQKGDIKAIITILKAIGELPRNYK